MSSELMCSCGVCNWCIEESIVLKLADRVEDGEDLDDVVTPQAPSYRARVVAIIRSRSTPQP